jgi:hypothetical protein
MASVSGLINNNLAVNTLDGLTTVNTSSGPVDPSAYVKYTGNTSDTDLGSYNIQTIHVPVGGGDLTNKTYVDQQDALKVAYTGATANVNLGAYGLTTTALTASGTITASGVATGTPAVTLGLNASNQIVSYANPTGAFTGSVSAGSIPYASSTNVFANSLLSQSGTTLSNSGNESITGSLTTTGNTSLTGGNITVSSTPVSWAVPYWTSTGYNLSSYSYTSGQGSAFGTVGATQCGLFSTGLSLAANTTYQMTITNMVFNSATGTNPYFTIQGGSSILYTSANNLTTTSTTRTFYFSTTVALPGGITLYFYDYLNGTTSPYFFFGTITLNVVSVQASSMAVVGNESVGGTLTVGGAETVGGTLSVTGATTLGNTLSVTGGATIGASMIAFNANHYNWNVNRFAGGGYYTTFQFWKLATLYGSTSGSMGAMYVRGMLGGWVVNASDQMEVDLYIMTRGGTVVNGRINSTNYANAVAQMDLQWYVNGSGYTEVYLVTKAATTYASFDLDVGSSGLQGTLTNVQLWDPATTTALTSAPGTMVSLTALCQIIQSGTSLGINTYTTAPLGMLQLGTSISGGATSDGTIVLGKTSGPSYRYGKIGIDDVSYGIALGDFGTSGATWTKQLRLHYNTPADTIVANSTGQVGIGTNAPASKLYVVDNLGIPTISTAGYFPAQIATSSSNLIMKMGSYYTAGVGEYGAIQCSEYYSNTEHPQPLCLQPLGGNVGIQTTSPSAPLDVQGVVRMGNYTGGNYDNIQFERTSSGVYPNINCGGNYSFMYVTDAGGWCGDTAVGDIGIYAGTGRNIRFGVGGANSSMYINSTLVNINKTLYLQSTGQNDQAWGGKALCLGSGNQICLWESVAHQIVDNVNIAWSGGSNYTYAFYKQNAYISIQLYGRYSCYTSSVGTQYTSIRIYNQSTGQYFYFNLQSFQNITYAHTVYPINITIQGTGYPAGWYDVYIYTSGGNSITDSNDVLSINASSFINNVW